MSYRTTIAQYFLHDLDIKQKIVKKPRFTSFHNPKPKVNTISITNSFNSPNLHPFLALHSPSSRNNPVFLAPHDGDIITR